MHRRVLARLGHELRAWVWEALTEDERALIVRRAQVRKAMEQAGGDAARDIGQEEATMRKGDHVGGAATRPGPSTDFHSITTRCSLPPAGPSRHRAYGEGEDGGGTSLVGLFLLLVLAGVGAVVALSGLLSVLGV